MATKKGLEANNDHALYRQVEFRVEQNPIDYFTRLWALHFDRHGDRSRCAVVTNVTYTVMEEMDPLPEPTFRLTQHELQMLMDQLWQTGVRPSEEGTAGQLSAVQYHLEDMRKLVFQKKE